MTTAKCASEVAAQQRTFKCGQPVTSEGCHADSATRTWAQPYSVRLDPYPCQSQGPCTDWMTSRHFHNNTNAPPPPVPLCPPHAESVQLYGAIFGTSLHWCTQVLKGWEPENPLQIGRNIPSFLCDNFYCMQLCQQLYVGRNQCHG
ncbi:hypothetical protein ABBQ38_012287 [Trebouxia sp. C0009 RCD-2024]